MLGETKIMLQNELGNNRHGHHVVLIICWCLAAPTILPYLMVCQNTTAYTMYYEAVNIFLYVIQYYHHQ